MLEALGLELAAIKGDSSEASAHYHLAAAELAALRKDAATVKKEARAALEQFRDKGAGYVYYARRAESLLQP
jgi:hypothetical protein